MTPEDESQLRELITHTRVMSLGVLVEAAPYVSLVPIALTWESDRLLIHASSMARHSRGLEEGAMYSGLLHQIDSPSADPLQLARLTIQGFAHRFDRDNPEYPGARDAYLARFPTSAPTFGLADFHLYGLSIARARFIAGFARAYNLTPERLREIARGE